ncbi:interferon lambda receptor 1 [Parus major]|uniref:interferon lambda receptor 1 n=1 Tax=Parus major TaxID=9157 RepID=UPI001443E816|nr:interferon lambda receptor 1 [Parus major]
MRMDQGKTFRRSGKFCFAVCGWRVGALMALCLLQQAPGHVQLLPPQNVTLLSKDFALILTWAPGEGSPPGVTYTVRYERNTPDILGTPFLSHPALKTRAHTLYLRLQQCKNLFLSFPAEQSGLKLSGVFWIRKRCPLLPCYQERRAGSEEQPWEVSVLGRDEPSSVLTSSHSILVELAPPVLTLNVSKNSLHVSASFPLPKCVENLTWKYDLNLWEAGAEDKKKYEGCFRKDTVTINTTALRGNYCFSARAVYESISLKYSEFSQPVCVQLNHKAVEWKFPLLVMILLLVLIFVVSPFICCLVKHEAKERKMPLVLDFSQFKAAGPALHLELSEKELCSDDLNCTERPVPQRRTNRALGEHHLPWVASFPSSSSSSEEEEEEDSSPLISYHEMPRYPKRHLRCQPPTAAPGESSLDSGSAGLSVDTRSVLELRALGFTLFAERKAELDTSGSQENEETSLYLCSSLGRISLTDVRFPAGSEDGQGDGNGDERMGMTPLHPLLGGTPAEPHELNPHKKAPHFSRDYQKSLVDLQLQEDPTSQPREDPSSQLLIPLWTLQLAEDEGIASDCGSDNFTEETLPDSTLLSEAFEASNTEEKYHPKFQFPGYKHSHYLGRI